MGLATVYEIDTHYNTPWASPTAQRSRICLLRRRPGFDPWVRKIPWRKKWLPTPVFLPGESQGRGSLVGCRLGGRTELDMTEATLQQQQQQQRVKRLPAMRETRVRSLGQEEPLEKDMATHSSILAWRLPWTEEPGRLQSTGSQRVEHD